MNANGKCCAQSGQNPYQTAVFHKAVERKVSQSTESVFSRSTLANSGFQQTSQRSLTLVIFSPQEAQARDKSLEGAAQCLLPSSSSSGIGRPHVVSGLTRHPCPEEAFSLAIGLTGIF